MKFRVKNIIETLKRLPAPEYAGQTLNVPVLTETWEYDLTQCDVNSKAEKLIVITAERYDKNGAVWFEWVCDI